MVKKREGFRVVVPKEQLDRIANGQCPSCAKPKAEWVRTTTFRCCSKECTEKYSKELITFGWPALRRKAILRDGKCVQCGIQHHQLKETTVWDYENYFKNYEIVLTAGEVYKQNGLQCINITIIDMSKYVCDHICPISLGGDEWEIANLQTLCIACNKIKTRTDIGKIAKLRVKEQLQNAGQKFLNSIKDNGEFERS